MIKISNDNILTEIRIKDIFAFSDIRIPCISKFKIQINDCLFYSRLSTPSKDHELVFTTLFPPPDGTVIYPIPCNMKPRHLYEVELSDTRENNVVFNPEQATTTRQQQAITQATQQQYLQDIFGFKMKTYEDFRSLIDKSPIEMIKSLQASLKY